MFELFNASEKYFPKEIRLIQILLRQHLAHIWYLTLSDIAWILFVWSFFFKGAASYVFVLIQGLGACAVYAVFWYRLPLGIGVFLHLFL